MEIITGKLVGVRREQGIGSSHPVYILDGMREVNYAHGSTICEQVPQVGDELRIEVTGQDSLWARRIDVVS